MILSIHIPKTAGLTFQGYLRSAFGARLRVDYTDPPGLQRPEDVASRRTRAAMLAARAPAIERRFDIIHGHFLPSDYDGLFGGCRYLTFVRDPYQQVVSFYQHLVRDRSHVSEPIRRNCRNVLDFVEMSAISQVLHVEQRIDDFELIGISEHFEQSLMLFQKLFEVRAPWNGARHNVNPARPQGEYTISDDLRRAVDKHRAQDIELYRKATERFARLVRLHGV